MGFAVLVIAGCGDGGGGVASTGIAPPVAVNASLAAQHVSQSFTNNAASTTASFDLASSNVTSGSSTSAPLTFSYDAASNSYTVTTQGRTQTFAPANITSAASGQAICHKTDGTNRDYLTVLAASVTGASGNGPQYTGMAYWQRSIVTASTQDTTLDILTYGLDTPAVAVPRSGQASFATTVFGLSTVPGSQPRVFQGTGQFDVDFVTGAFSTTASTTETQLVSGYAIHGGGVGIIGSGYLSSTDGTFSGSISYGGSDISSQGPLDGRLYGPHGTELGATFTTTGSDGSSASGAFVGVQESALTPANLTIVNPATDQLYYVGGVQMETNHPSPTTWSANPSVGSGQFTTTKAGSVEANPLSSDLEPGATFATADQIASTNANFTSYQKTTDGRTENLDLYKPGSANSELALTYMSFGHWQGPPAQQGATNIAQYYFVYGVPTQPAALAARTGSAQYSGVAYGSSFDSSNGVTSSLTGTSAFAVDFSHASYTGNLALKSTSGSAGIDFGSFTFASTLNSGQPLTANITQGSAQVGQLDPQFYGPTGEEIGGPFQIYLPNAQSGTATTIVGVAVARRH